MTACLEVIDGGVAVTVQDGGRRGHRGIGVPLAGAVDRWLLACANALLGQDAECAGLEIGLVGPQLRARGGAVQLSWVGDLAPQLLSCDEPARSLSSWRSITLASGETLRLGACRSGVGYVGIAGGVAVRPVLGSRATYTRAALGGVDGRALRAGDVLPSGAAAAAPRQATPFKHVGGAIRVLSGPQADHFDDDARSTLARSTWQVSREADRMGLRLEGPVIRHRQSRGADIVSEAVVPGAVQVPGSGLPIVLGVDAQTIGGYAKIGTVITADLPRLAHHRPGDTLHFAFVSREEALVARLVLQQAFSAWSRSITPLRGGDASAERLATYNLISGMIDAGQVAVDQLPWEHESR